MTNTARLLLLAGVTYFIGSIPFGLIIGKAKGIDPRTAGSGNIGATNVGRLLGGRYFAIVFILDMLKSLVPMLVAGAMVPAANRDWRINFALLLVGLAAILGHQFSVFLKFKGGKGVATSAGVVLGLFPYYTAPAVVALLTFIFVFLIWRYVSLGSIVAAGMFPVYFLTIGIWRQWDVFGARFPLLIFAVLMGLLIIYKHRGNIARLRAGNENKIPKRANTRSH
jgi:acyl phosphate:glycerol-3-phosphate acyltransferase